jgi:uncharacterized protein YcgI (DUF1989 family)
MEKGQFVSIIDIEGGQVVDFLAFNRDSHVEKLSPSHTRLALLSLKIKVGDKLRTSLRNPMFEVMEDTVETHDLLIPACDERRYLVDYGIENHRSCVANFEEVLTPYGIMRSQFPNPLNVFQNTPIDSEGNLVIQSTISKRGDYLLLRALMDVVCAVSACPFDLDSSGVRITDIMVEIHEIT